MNLPCLSEEIEAGLNRIGVDSSLPDDRRLPILQFARNPVTHDMIKANSVVWAYTQFQDPIACRMFVNGVAALLDLGLIRRVGQIPDGDWKFTQEVLTTDEVTFQTIKEIVTIDDIKKSTTVAVATKVNFWLMNHHTGQHAVSGYIKKVLDMFYPGRVTDQVVSAAHNLGRFASTLYVLHVADIANLRQTTPVTSVQGATFTLADDVKLRFKSMPAGTNRLAVSFEAAKRLVRNVYAKFCPRIEEFGALPERRNLVLAEPARYHLRALYLTGSPRTNYADTDMESYMGRLGTFINVLCKNSTLAKSSYFQTARVESYEDYDAGFKILLGRIRQLELQSAQGKIAEVEKEEMASNETIEGLRRLFR